MTAGLANAAVGSSPWKWTGADEGAIEQIAISWAVLRYAAPMPASVEDQLALQEATNKVLALARRFGLDEDGLRDVLRRCQAIEEPDRWPSSWEPA